jgi:hypothetical protein
VEKSTVEQLALYVFVVVPFLALAATVPAVWGWGLSWTDVTLAAVFYVLTGLGITVGYHRHLTHGSFKAGRPLRIALAVAGCMAVQGPVVQWVADHRRHHAFSDREGDPHSPWRYGDDTRAAQGHVPRAPGSRGTTCTTRPDLRPARRAARPGRHQRPGHLAVRAAGLGAGREVARPGPAGRQATAARPGSRVTSGGACRGTMAA